MHVLSASYLQAVKRILTYVKGTVNYRIRTLSNNMHTYPFIDADWSSCRDTRRSTTGYCMFIGSNCVSWSAKNQPMVAQSSAEAEYLSMAVPATELTWITSLLSDIGISLKSPLIFYYDNLSVIYLTRNPVFHAQMKHIEIDYNFVREKVANGSLVTRFVPVSDIS